ncbi:MAG: nucleoside monophosphate kinase [Mycoplasmataceae bacterium]|nr:nucleoside monophosphate kinase [Mycoplasmataceae bacterium]
MLLIFLGAPGSGKGTISEIMVSHYGYKHISTGSIFRKNIINKTKLGMKVKKLLEDGNLVDDITTWKIAKEALKEIDLINDKVILDGFPRNIYQSELMCNWLKENGLPSPKQIYFKISKKKIIERLTGRIMCKICGKTYHKLLRPPLQKNICDIDNGELFQRKDDKKDNVQIRLDAYKNMTKPLIKHYSDLEKLISINGEETQEVIAKIILNIVENKN